ncbi:unnamed protein product [Symbiodinium necroappetens]|uniref:Uncharacterized protein n=1 Tax=Symbiodinium necroappetens TaxID=1628268 RepID=A0A812J4K0_9DINO|nr:unnamed protein product [Symbiodinium necroappetens]|mmetsp:Transcript_69476/g.165644  ORF Transcript_69476/g.165644 Transcript_69476/m.165644 type:complete len:658 (+) Transcript_69476:57-2030(+)
MGSVASTQTYVVQVYPHIEVEAQAQPHELMVSEDSSMQELELSNTVSSQSSVPPSPITSPSSPPLFQHSEMSNQSRLPASEPIKSPRLFQQSEMSQQSRLSASEPIKSPRLLQLSETSSKQGTIRSETSSQQSSQQPAEPKTSPRLLDPSLTASTGSGSSLRDVMGQALTDYASLTKSERHNSRRYSEVDMAMVRGISLRSSLRGLGRLWRYKASWKPQERAALYELSSPAMSFKVFVSHTWQTPGRWKILGLSLQCGWRSALGFWFMAVVVSFALCALDILPMPFSYEPTMAVFPETYAMGFWVVPSGMIATLVGLVAAPYWPERCSGSDTSFIDVASIHQVDRRLMEKGIYGIAGFLRISQELRILFSAPYFSRLWCVFEVAAYKKLNPQGTIKFKPVFVEAVVVGLLLSAYCFSFIFMTWRILDADGLEANAWVFAAFASWFVPLGIATYGLRIIFREKYRLLSELEDFDLDYVHCSKQFDRDFIHAAIVKWYGSKANFTTYVRCGLKDELATSLFAARMPHEYLLLILTPFLGLCFEMLLAMWKSGVPPEQLMAFLLAAVLGLDIFWFGSSMVLLVCLCDYLAVRRFGCCDHLQTFAIILAVAGLIGGGTQLCVYACQSLDVALLYLGATMLMALSVWWLEGKACSCPVGHAR